MFEPSELEKGMLTSKDGEIRNADVPERFQVSCESNNRLFVKDLEITMLRVWDIKKVMRFPDRIKTLGQGLKKSPFPGLELRAGSYYECGPWLLA